ncbi:hypothetical protein J4480_04755 [Candidatus Woesearchaeota archaeon]|nr:hypothetical protein [Candidatus Woesearchaeota archaeon]
MTKTPFYAILYLVVLTIFFLLSADFYLKKGFYPPSSDEFLSNPSKYAGQNTKFTGSIINITANSFYMRVNQKPIKIHYPGMEKPKFGQVYTLVRLNHDGTATALQVHNLSYNYIKYILSFFAFILFLFIFFREWKLDGWRFAENA